jgi:hypothetical protein
MRSSPFTRICLICINETFSVVKKPVEKALHLWNLLKYYHVVLIFCDLNMDRKREAQNHHPVLLESITRYKEFEVAPNVVKKYIMFTRNDGQT